MKFSKKLLATLLPITATSMLVPVLASCNNGNSYSINYGDEVNCLDEKGNNYHSIDDVKNVVKKHASIEHKSQITSTELEEFQWSLDSVKQFMYYDLIASIAILNASKLHLTWNLAAEGKKINLVYADKDGTPQTLAADELSYSYNTETKIIYINLVGAEGDGFKSYNFQNTKIGE